MVYIHVKNYEHINSALPNWDTPRGKYISSKKQYFEELRKNGLVPYEEAQRKDKKYEPSQKCVQMMREVLSKKDKNLNLSQHPKLVQGMKELGVKFELPDWCPKHYSKEGGYATS